MNDEQYLQYCKELFDQFGRDLEQRVSHLPDGDPLRELAAGFVLLTKDGSALYSSGAALVPRLFTTYPELAPLFPRQLLWFLGGECLHLMPEDEIERYQQLEELRLQSAARGELFNFREASAKLLKLQ